jgi:hypothetical protein
LGYIAALEEDGLPIPEKTEDDLSESLGTFFLT